MMKISKTLTALLLVATAMLSSCLVEDFGVDDESSQVSSLSLERGVVYLMTGESFTFTPTLKPDSLSNSLVYYTSRADSIASMDGSTVVAKEVGWTTVVATSVSGQLKDSCIVYVMDPWQLPQKVYPYETPVYVTVTVDGRPADDNCLIAAFIDDEVRAFGQTFSQNGVSCMRFRDDDDEEVDDDDDSPVVGDKGTERKYDIISFRCYDRRTCMLYYSRLRIYSNGYSHGKPSDPIKLEFQ